MRKLVAATLLVTSFSCKGEKQKQTDLYEAAWKQFHKAPPTTLDKVQLLLGSKGHCGREALYVMCEWQVPTTTATRRIQVACDDDTATARVRYAVFPDETDRQFYVPVAKCTCDRGDPLCAEIPDMTCARR